MWVGDKIYVSGQVGMTLEGVLVPGIANQTRVALQYIGHILREAKSDFGYGNTIYHGNIHIIFINVYTKRTFLIDAQYGMAYICSGENNRSAGKYF